MLYKQHNFYSNFMNASGADSDSALRIFSDEVAVLAMNHRPTVEYALKNSGISVPVGMTRKQLISLVAENLSDNETLRKSIAQLIVNRHQAQGTMNMSGGYANASGSGAGAGALQGLMGAGVPADPVSAVASAVGGLAGAFRGSSDKKISQEQTKQAMIMALAQRQQQAAPAAKKMPTWAIVTLSVVGVAAVAGLVVFIVKRSKK